MIDVICIRLVPLRDINLITTRLHHKHALLLHFHFTFNMKWKLTDETADVRSISRIKHNPLWTCDRVLQKIDWVYSASNFLEEVYTVCTPWHYLVI